MNKKSLFIFTLGFFFGCGLLAFISIDKPNVPIVAQVLSRESYITSYDGRCRNPFFVQEFLTAESIKKNASRKGINFKEDVAIADSIRSKLSDYKNSGYDRGHLAPCADCTYSKEALEDTFFLSNVAPQEPNFNRGKWKELEQYVRSLVVEYQALEVVSGPLYIAHSEPNGKRVVSYQVIGENDVAVPNYFFKIVRSKDKTWSWILPNQAIDKDVPLSDFEVTIEKIEKLSGIIFQ